MKPLDTTKKPFASAPAAAKQFLRPLQRTIYSVWAFVWGSHYQLEAARTFTVTMENSITLSTPPVGGYFCLSFFGRRPWLLFLPSLALSRECRAASVRYICATGYDSQGQGEPPHLLPLKAHLPPEELR